MSKSITSSFIFTLLQLGCLSALTIMSLPSIDVPVFVLTDYQISFLRDEFEKSVQNVAEIAS